MSAARSRWSVAQSRYLRPSRISSVERQFRDAVVREGTAKRALVSLKKGPFREWRSAQRTLILCALCAVGLAGVVVISILAVLLADWLEVLNSPAARSLVNHPFLRDLILYAGYSMVLANLLLPIVMYMQRHNRLISNIVTGITDLNDDGTLKMNDRPYAVYLRSFTAERHYLDETYNITLGMEVEVRRRLHPGYFVKQSLAALQSEIEIVEALNLSDERTPEHYLDFARFRSICLFEFADWPDRVRILCRDAAIIFFHLDDTSDGLREELDVIDEFSHKTVVFGPQWLQAVEFLRQSEFRWLAIVVYEPEIRDGVSTASESISALNATIRTQEGLTSCRYDGQWLRNFIYARMARNSVS